MAEREAHIAPLHRIHDREAEQLAELDQRRHRRRVAPRGRHHDDRIVRRDQPARDLVGVPGGRRGGARDAEPVGAREAGAVDREQGELLGEAQIDRAAGLAPRHLHRAAGDGAGVVLPGQPMVPLDVVADDPVLVERLLHPEMPALVAPALERPGIGRRREAGGDDHRQAAPRRGMDGAAVMHRAAIDMGRGHGGPAAHRREAERGVEARMLVRHGDQPDRVVGPPGARLGGGLLEEADLRPRGEEEVVDPARREPRDQRIAHVVGRRLRPARHPPVVHRPPPIRFGQPHHAALAARRGKGVTMRANFDSQVKAPRPHRPSAGEEVVR